MTPQARPAFELLRFTAAPVADALALVDVEGRFGTTGRFGRRPALVVEPADGQALELSPVHVDADGDHWCGTYAVPLVSVLDARFALAVRGTLVELPAPDRLEAAAGAGERTMRLAREANALRRALERAEAQATQAEDHAEAAEQRAADAEQRAVEAAERVGVLERAIRELEQRILGAEGEAEDAQWRVEEGEQALGAAVARASDAEERAAQAEAQVEEQRQRADDAEERAERAEQRAAAAEDGLRVLREELAEERERADRLARQPPDITLPFEPVSAPSAPDDPYEEDDEDRGRTPPGGIVRTQVGPVRMPRPVPVARPRPRHRLERWLAVLALLLLVAVVVALAFSIRA